METLARNGLINNYNYHEIRLPELHILILRIGNFIHALALINFIIMILI